MSDHFSQSYEDYMDDLYEDSMFQQYEDACKEKFEKDRKEEVIVFLQRTWRWNKQKKILQKLNICDDVIGMIKDYLYEKSIFYEFLLFKVVW